jgi:hypothetical protein
VYQQDEFGTFKPLSRWVEAWRGGAGSAAGWCVNELRQYEDGTMRVHTEPTHYLIDEDPKTAAVHEFFILASNLLVSS